MNFFTLYPVLPTTCKELLMEGTVLTTSAWRRYGCDQNYLFISPRTTFAI